MLNVVFRPDRRVVQAAQADVTDNSFRLGGSLAGHLVPELLTDIMLQVMIAANGWLFNDSFDLDGQYYRWMAVAQVCQHWRRVAIGYPRLWAAIVVGKLELFQIFLSRSKNALLSLFIGLASEDAIVPLITRERHRIELFCVSSVSNRFYSALCTISEQEFPLVRQFRSERSHLSRTQGPQSQFLVPVLYRNRFPMLDSLLLDGYTVAQFKPLNRQSLTRLHFTSTDTFTSFSIADVVNELAQLPLLEELVLQDIFFGSPYDPSVPSRVVSLPNMRSITLVHSNNSPKLPVTLLKYLSFPATASVTVQEGIDWRYMPTVDLSSALPILADVWSALRTPGSNSPLTTLSITHDTFPPAVIFRAQSHAPHVVPDEVQFLIVLNIFDLIRPFRIRSYKEAIYILLGFVIPRLPVHLIKSLRIESGLSRGFLWKVYGHMCQVRELCVAFGAVYSLPSALCAGLKGSAQPNRPILFPRLDKLILQDIGHRAPPARRTKTREISVFTQLVDALKKRQVEGMKVKQIILQRCVKLTAEEMEGFKGIVDSVLIL